MDYSLFNDIVNFDEGKRVAGRQAGAVAFKRVSDTVGGYLKIAKSPEEYTARLDFVSDDIKRIVADVAEEYNSDVDALQKAIDDHLEGEGITDLNEELDDAPSAVGHKAAGGHKDGCECGFCKNKGNLPGSDKKEHDKETHEGDESESADDDGGDDDGGTTASIHVAEADRDGGGATKTMDMPSADPSGLGGPEPKIDKRTWKPNALNDSTNTPPVDTEMSGSPVPTKEQDISDTPDYEGDFLRDTDAVTESQSLPEAGDTGQSTEKNISQEGQGGTWTEVQNDPVTSAFAPTSQVESAIAQFEAEKE